MSITIGAAYKLDELGVVFANCCRCCIDKSSSAELSEAINSMWSWYQESVLCIAHLPDIEDLAVGHETVLSQLKTSRWFTRGWTLQELLAPAEVVFCNVDWQMIGSKAGLYKSRRWMQVSLTPTHEEMIEALVETTGIARKYLLQGTDSYKDSPIDRECIAKKLSWASERLTTRSEDRAYCLLGLVGVNMPLLYGEGGHTAFRRLQREFIRQSDDESIFAWKKDSLRLTEICGLLAPNPSWFRDSGSVKLIKHTSSEYQRRSPYSITNKGLQIDSEAVKLAYVQTHDDPFGMTVPVFVISLNCQAWSTMPNDDGSVSNRPDLCTIVLVDDKYISPLPRIMAHTLSHDFQKMGLTVVREETIQRSFLIELAQPRWTHWKDDLSCDQ